MIRTRQHFIVLSRWTLRLTVLVILWGAFVRLSGSGDGCGQSWPLCQGVLVPRSPTTETIIELLHRATSGLVFILAATLAWSARRLFPRNDLARRSAAWAFLFMICEAGIGAVLVLFGWVDQNPSHARMLSLSLHLANTFLLLCAISATLYFARHERVLQQEQWLRLRSIGGLGLALLVITGVAGVLAALANMQFPSSSLLAGLSADFDASSPFLVRIRILHPVSAVLATFFLIWFSMTHLRQSLGVSDSKRAALLVRLVLGQMLLGVLTLIIGTSVVMKLLHLLVADLIVIVYAALIAECVSRPRAAIATSGVASVTHNESSAAHDNPKTGTYG